MSKEELVIQSFKKLLSSALPRQQRTMVSDKKDNSELQDFYFF